MRIRDLEETDYEKGVLDLLAQLTEVKEISKEQFNGFVASLQSSNGFHRVVVMEDVEKLRIIGSATLLIERKLVHGLGLVGHIEDVVVDKRYRGQKLGLRLIERLKATGKDQGCYKIILDCARDKIPFYQKAGFQEKQVQMAWYL
jgi:glucosamine-phosphate N-acetyltransferase